MKEMVYTATPTRRATVLQSNTYKSYNYLVVSMGTHPCAYVRIPEKHPFFQKHYDAINPISIDFKGALFTFSDSSINFAPYLDLPIPDGWYLGWDYAHIGDYIAGVSQADERKYTTSEIIEDCKNIIDFVLIPEETKNEIQVKT